MCFVALAAGTGFAQDLPRLHITALGMHADRSVVTPGEAFHVTVHVHVLEKRDRLDELVLPALSDAVDLGDERRRVFAADGTDFYETLTVAANVVGTATFTPAYVDAIDPATGRGMRYSSQPVSVRVVAGTSPADADSNALAGALRDAVLALSAAAAVLVLGVVAWARSRRSRRRTPRPAPAMPSVAPPPPPSPAGLSAIFAAYRIDASDVHLDDLRNALFERAGARSGATFADAMRALGPRDPALVRVMAVAERARFGPVAERAAARADLLAVMDAYVRDREPVA